MPLSDEMRARLHRNRAAAALAAKYAQQDARSEAAVQARWANVVAALAEKHGHEDEQTWNRLVAAAMAFRQREGIR